MTSVKKGSVRAEKARETRRRILEAARRLFVAQGYGATSLQEIADEAGVAVQTIYFGFGNKRTVLKELVDVTIAGDDAPVATLERPWFQAVLDAKTAGKQLEAHVEGTRPILERVAPILRVLDAAAAADPEVVALWPADDPRYVVHLNAAKALLDKPGVRKGVDAEQAADVLYGLLSPELYLVMTVDRGWSDDQWQAWTLDLLKAQLLGRRS
ncbi:TetR/AcrR family transcriptional regulator [Kribbella sp. NBC_01245]|uniref:TetR/AcrR family transcriptional regulator n=1 Tax=Kribbella sp. NBC_01245 TaxID=2903578 RepID=UPI002E2D89DF|nr:helix-turn-helix domain-containing protein [Kribbella sp. NBC_01245]